MYMDLNSSDCRASSVTKVILPFAGTSVFKCTTPLKLGRDDSTRLKSVMLNPPPYSDIIPVALAAPPILVAHMLYNKCVGVGNVKSALVRGSAVAATRALKKSALSTLQAICSITW